MLGPEYGNPEVVTVHVPGPRSTASAMGGGSRGGVRRPELVVGRYAEEGPPNGHTPRCRLGLRCQIERDFGISATVAKDQLNRAPTSFSELKKQAGVDVESLSELFRLGAANRPFPVEGLVNVAALAKDRGE